VRATFHASRKAPFRQITLACASQKPSFLRGGRFGSDSQNQPIFRLKIDVRNFYRLCENSKNIEKWRAAIELLRASGRAMDEKCRKSPAISWLPPARSSFHTVCLNSARKEVRG